VLAVAFQRERVTLSRRSGDHVGIHYVGKGETVVGADEKRCAGMRGTGSRKALIAIDDLYYLEALTQVHVWGELPQA
jgi:hypothetical protein